MCGIAGLLDASGAVSADDLGAIAEAMATRLAHRGPDDAGTWVDAAAGVALAHRRLSILDLSPEGHQPMSSASGRFVLSYNGEIYNHLELRRELEPQSIRFRGHSDTEVLLAAVERWGLREALCRSNGMFAAALWDRAERRLHLFRDRFGEKPLFCGWSNGQFVFGSELKALVAQPTFRGEIDPGALALFLRYGFVPAPRSIYRGISKVLPGTITSVAATGPGQVETLPYWSAREAIVSARSAPFCGEEREAADRIHELLLDSVRIRMVADVPLGAFLSGGIDSSTVVALMQAQSSRPIRTFSIGFESPEHDEAPRARAVAAHLGTDHTELYVTDADTLSVIRKLPQLYDEPFSDSSQIPTFLVAQLARRSVTVGLSGDGGDEVFAGYTRYRIGELIWRATRSIPGTLRRGLARAVEASPAGAWSAADKVLHRVLGLRSRSAADGLQTIADYLRAKDAGALYRRLVSTRGDSGDLGAATVEPLSQIGDEEVLPSLDTFSERMMFWDTLTYLPDDILTKVDRATMSVSLEARVPFLDHRVFALAWRLPLTLKLRAGVSKRPIRAVLDRYVPPELVEGPKKGFAVPLADWLRGPLRTWAQDLLATDRLERQGILDPCRYARLLDEHLSGARDRRHELWNALVLQGWLDSLGLAAGALGSRSVF